VNPVISCQSARVVVAKIRDITFAIAVFHAKCNGAQMESGLFGKLERRHGAFRTTFTVAASVTLLKHLEKFRARRLPPSLA